MLDRSTVVAFVATAAPEDAKPFYRDVLGLRMIGEDPFALTFEANGMMLRIQKVPALTPQPFTVLGWQVPSIAKVIDGLVLKGVRFERYPGLAQDERGIWTAPSGARVAWFKDLDGNTLSLTESP
jgi:catechol 2,3-dioxygenase-like lactoylglutathione lyase family enzyme